MKITAEFAVFRLKTDEAIYFRFSIPKSSTHPNFLLSLPMLCLAKTNLDNILFRVLTILYNSLFFKTPYLFVYQNIEIKHTLLRVFFSPTYV